MSRAFLRDDAEGEMPRRNYGLPPRDDPEFDRVAARALLEAARVSETQLAERATGYYWGEPKLRPYVQELLAEAEAANRQRHADGVLPNETQRLHDAEAGGYLSPADTNELIGTPLSVTDETTRHLKQPR